MALRPETADAGWFGRQRSVNDLVEVLVIGRRGVSPTLLPIDDLRIPSEAFKILLPVCSLRAAAGYFGRGAAAEREGWVEADGVGKLDEKMFVARVVGQSMEPRIHDGDCCVFRAKASGTRQGKIVLAQYRGPADPETGGSFTIKRYSSEKVTDPTGAWRHTKVVLSPLNPEYQLIEITPGSEEDVQVVAEWLAVLRRA